MFNDTVTVYNKYVDAAGAEKWQRTVLKSVFWNATRAASVRKTGVQTVDSFQIIIPSSVRPSRQAHREPKAWAALTDKSGAWTLQAGDTIIKGDISVEVVKSVKELQTHDDVMTVSSVDNKSFGGGMAHWEVSGK